MPADIVGWAIENKLELVALTPPVSVEGEELFGIVAIPAECALHMFRRDGTGPRSGQIYRVRKPTDYRERTGDAAKWNKVTEPAGGVEIQAADIMLTNTEVERFEEEHALTRRLIQRGGGAARWDWEAFWVAVLCRVHNRGLPETQRALAIEMQEWFMRRSDTGEAPDERTILRKISEMWRQLHSDDRETA